MPGDEYGKKSDGDREYQTEYEIAKAGGVDPLRWLPESVVPPTNAQIAGRADGASDRAAESGTPFEFDILGGFSSDSEKPSGGATLFDCAEGSSSFGASISHAPPRRRNIPNLGKSLFLILTISFIVIGIVIGSVEPSPEEKEAHRLAGLSAWVYMASSPVIQHRNELRRGTVNIAYMGARRDGEFLPSDQYRLAGC
ncbi:hypothetical protein [Roseovarius nanhaiticus]|uniref:hypothetical protein n=1 Tax=Roseovarius nanhaiticus TaxID=573024 RepID=UPI002490B526|nr:hypothetical protein [Roseovarius nanhaiticus]